MELRSVVRRSVTFSVHRQVRYPRLCRLHEKRNAWEPLTEMTSVSSLKKPYSTDFPPTAMPDLQPWGSTCARRNARKSPTRFIQRGFHPASFTTNIRRRRRDLLARYGVCPRKTGLLSARQPGLPRTATPWRVWRSCTWTMSKSAIHGRSRKAVQQYYARSCATSDLSPCFAWYTICPRRGPVRRSSAQCVVRAKCVRESLFQTAPVGCRGIYFLWLTHSSAAVRYSDTCKIQRLGRVMGGGLTGCNALKDSSQGRGKDSRQNT